MSEVSQTKPAESARAAESAASPRGAWLLLGFSLLAAVAVLLGLHFGVGVAIDGPTLALAAACIVLIWSLRSLWRVVEALSRPAIETLIVEGAETGADASKLAELREDKRRLLRAIKELEFDHAMGKLSDEDFREIGDRYRLRAIEVLRLLDEGGDLHPQLAEHLAALGVKLEPTSERAAS
jgi:molybdenum-dependent DNA-binding transcriptional regulator ModE